MSCYYIFLLYQTQKSLQFFNAMQLKFLFTRYFRIKLILQCNKKLDIDIDFVYKEIEQGLLKRQVSF